MAKRLISSPAIDYSQPLTREARRAWTAWGIACVVAGVVMGFAHYVLAASAYALLPFTMPGGLPWEEPQPERIDYYLSPLMIAAPAMGALWWAFGLVVGVSLLRLRPCGTWLARLFGRGAIAAACACLLAGGAKLGFDLAAPDSGVQMVYQQPNFHIHDSYTVLEMPLLGSVSLTSWRVAGALMMAGVVGLMIAIALLRFLRRRGAEVA